MPRLAEWLPLSLRVGGGGLCRSDSGNSLPCLASPSYQALARRPGREGGCTGRNGISVRVLGTPSCSSPASNPRPGLLPATEPASCAPPAAQRARPRLNPRLNLSHERWGSAKSPAGADDVGSPRSQSRRQGLRAMGISPVFAENALPPRDQVAQVWRFFA